MNENFSIGTVMPIINTQYNTPQRFFDASSAPLSYRLCIKESGIMVLQGCYQDNFGEYEWQDLPTHYEGKSE